MTTIIKDEVKFDVQYGLVPGDEYFWNLVNRHGWEQQLFNTLKAELKPSSVFIDIGAWIGPVSLYAAKLGAYVHAIEPDSVAFDALTKHISLNLNVIHGIKAYNLAIMDYNGFVELGTRGQRGDSLSCVNCEGVKEKAVCVTLKRFLTQANLHHVDFIKIDIEGGETILVNELIEIWRYIGKPKIYMTVHQPFFKNKEEGIEKIVHFLEWFRRPDLIDSVKTGVFTDIFINN